MQLKEAEVRKSELNEKLEAARGKKQFGLNFVVLEGQVNIAKRVVKERK